MNVESHVMFFYPLAYFLGEKGERLCQVGDLIDSKDECRIACGVLEMPIGRLKERRPCYRAGNGKCKQDGRHGSSATMICKNKGNFRFSKLRIPLIPSFFRVTVQNIKYAFFRFRVTISHRGYRSVLLSKWNEDHKCRRLQNCMY